MSAVRRVQTGFCRAKELDFPKQPGRLAVTSNAFGRRWSPGVLRLVNCCARLISVDEIADRSAEVSHSARARR